MLRQVALQNCVEDSCLGIVLAVRVVAVGVDLRDMPNHILITVLIIQLKVMNPGLDRLGKNGLPGSI